MNNIVFIGSAFGHGAQVTATSKGPDYLKNQYKITDKLEKLNIKACWYKTVNSKKLDFTHVLNKGRYFNAVLEHNKNLFKTVKTYIEEKNIESPFIIGGDHSCAIGTWSGIIDALSANENFGLIWIDAHMDAHIYETSPSKAYHGMPLSVLLGRGDKAFLDIGKLPTKINPNHLVLIGVRSYETSEAEFLKSMGVKIFTAEETKLLGLQKVFNEALSIVTKAGCGFGISFDLDAIDPLEAPAVGSPEPNGLFWENIKEILPPLFQHPKFKALEVVEFNPERDKNDMSADIILQIACQLACSGK